MNNSGFVGLGDYTMFTPEAFLHINQPSQHNPSGNLIRTDGDAALDLTWSMFSSMGGGSFAQRARFLLSPNTSTQSTGDPWESNMINDSENHLRIESTLGDVVFRAHGANSTDGTKGTLSERLRVSGALFTDPHWGMDPVTATRVSISSRPGSEITDPLAMLHIGDPADFQYGGHRQWMNSGTYVQRGSDNVFFGMRPREASTNSDQNDAIIAWGDNIEPLEKDDALRVVFCGIYNPAAMPGEVHHLNGLETMRIHPLGNIGIGDFSVNGLAEKPTEKLDIAGRLRVRDVPLNPAPEVLIVGREMDTVGDYLHNHLPFPGDNTLFLSGTGEWLPGGLGSDCRWVDAASNTISGELDMTMGFDPNENCHRGKLGVGIEQIKDAKMEVHNYYDRDKVRPALLVKSTGDWDNDENFIYGVYAEAHGTTVAPTSDRKNTYVGVLGMAHEGGHTVGVLGRGAGNYNAINKYNIGVYATAFDTTGPNGIDIGLYTAGSDYAAIIYGAVANTNSPINLSDESVKTDIQPIENATDVLSQLQPKSYTMVNPEGRDLNFDDDLQFGFLAQDVNSVLPNIVEDFHVPDMLDSTGFVSDTHLDLKGIQYQEFIPLLVAGFQEQQAAMGIQEATIAEQDEAIVEQNEVIEDQNATIEALQHQLETQAEQMDAQAQRIADLEDDLKRVLTSLQQTKSDVNHCCGRSGATGQNDNGPAVMDGVELEQNMPNPFADHTTIAFDLPDAAVVRVEISDSAGRVLETLVGERMDAGRHQVRWDGSRYPSGVYYYSLYADAALLTKKMIKR